ncbi:MAG: glutathione-dependent formaldehyde dehydrogenase [Blastochloris viridis]|uniref:Glutathione-dependent formaldehyde dehydrogenase n=1 Tax=Blastochloris viridis TaxID=1079 RepID=A0A6N4R3K6_BLAVI|nr:MAG: glutathione-dependent formaldehyde dehydrogenase [Blastochloris viridis]
MRALCWHGTGDIRCETVPDPILENDDDIIIRVTSCAICGSDLHLMGGFVPSMKSGDVLGHETMGEVVAAGKAVRNLKEGDRVVIPFTISCGECRYCKSGLYSLCERSNPNGKEQAKILGYPTAGLFGYSHAYGGFAGGQAEYLRVPYANVGPLKVPEHLTDEQVLFLSDIFPTGYMAAENCNLKGGETVVVFGCGPVGLFSIKSCFLLGAAKVIAIDAIEERLGLAKAAGAEILDYHDEDLQEKIVQMTGGKGPDAVIEAVGMESHGAEGFMETLQSKLTSTQRPYALTQAAMAVRPGGVISIPGVFINATMAPMGHIVGKGLTVRSGQTHVQKYMPKLLDHIEKGEIDPTFLITHRVGLEDGPEMYKTFRDKTDGCVKVVIKP